MEKKQLGLKSQFIFFILKNEVKNMVKPNYGKQSLSAQKSSVAGILREAGFSKDEIFSIIGNLTEKHTELMRDLIQDRITLSVFLWRAVWFSQVKNKI